MNRPIILFLIIQHQYLLHQHIDHHTYHPPLHLTITNIDNLIILHHHQHYMVKLKMLQQVIQKSNKNPHHYLLHQHHTIILPYHYLLHIDIHNTDINLPPLQIISPIQQLYPIP